MNTLDLDQLRQQWSAQTHDVDAQLHLDVDAVRRRLTARSATALARQRRHRLHALVFGGAGFAATLAFAFAHLRDLPYLLLALPFALLLLVNGAVDLREWLALGRIDFARPLTQLRAAYDELRARRLQMVQVIAQLSGLLWLPLIMLLMKGIAGVDLLRYLPTSLMAIYIGIGVVLVPSIALIVRRVARYWPDSGALRRFADGIAGSDWQRASDALDRQLDFEHEAIEAPEDALDSARQRSMTPRLEQLRRAACRRVDIGLVVITALILLSGGFNARHGDDLTALIPGVFLHLLAIVWLVVAIMQREALATPDTDTVSAWAVRLQSVLRRRRVLLQGSVIAAPLVALALLQSATLGIARVNLWQSLGLAAWVGLGSVALIATALAFRRRQRAPRRFAAAAVEALSLGSIDAAQRVVDAVDDAHDGNPCRNATTPTPSRPGSASPDQSRSESARARRHYERP